MAVTWPPTLQQYLNRAEWQRSPDDNAIRTQVETGPKKKRRRYTDPSIAMRCAIWIHRDDWPAFESFYEDDLFDGVLTFDFVDPITGQSREWRFVEQYRVRGIGGEYFNISMNWESIGA